MHDAPARLTLGFHDRFPPKWWWKVREITLFQGNLGVRWNIIIWPDEWVMFMVHVGIQVPWIRHFAKVEDLNFPILENWGLTVNHFCDLLSRNGKNTAMSVSNDFYGSRRQAIGRFPHPKSWRLEHQNLQPLPFFRAVKFKAFSIESIE